MKYTPILFSPEMTQAILSGTKTQTRRIIKNNNPEEACPYGQIGDILWVPKEWPEESNVNLAKVLPQDPNCIFLKITDIRVERLQDITRGDAMSEGCPLPNMAKGPNPIDWFSELWKSLKGEESWNANPLVWVITFERIDKPENFG